MTVMSTTAGYPPYPKITGFQGKKKIVLTSQEGQSMKCNHCGMSESGNPAHGSDYSGPGKHGFKSTTKSVSDLLVEDSPIYFGDSIKALGNGRIGGWAVVFTKSDQPDLTNDYFDAKTDFFFLGETKAARPLLYDHGLNSTIKSRQLGTANLEIKDVGVWFESQLDMSNAYDKSIYKLAEMGKLGASTGSAPHLIQREAVGKSFYVKSWPIVELSVTPKPIEPKTKGAVVTLKSIIDDDTRVDLLDGLKAQIDNVDKMPHQFAASDDDPAMCDECDETFADGNHASRKALEFLKGGPGSGRRPGGGREKPEFYGTKEERIAGHEELASHHDLQADSQELGEEVSATAHDRAMEAHEAAAAALRTNSPNADKLSLRAFKLSDKANGKKSFDRSFKGIFEEELAETGTSYYTLGQVLCETMKDIANAADTVDISGGNVDLRIKVTEAVTEYAARLIPMLVNQIQEWLDNGGLDQGNSLGGPASASFYVKSFLSNDSPLQSFLGMKSAGGVRLPINEHSTLAVSALSEYASMSESLNEGIKSFIERLEDKIQFRSETKSGRTISKATRSKLQEALDRLQSGSALNAELGNHISGIMALAEPQKGIDATGMLTLMLAEHDNDMAGVSSPIQ